MNYKKHAVIRLDEVGSTNDYAKEKRVEGRNIIVVAKSQTGGRGTKGRSFSSVEGGVYLSKLTFYENFPARRAFEIMVGAAVAVCETLKSYGFVPKIKWPNDIHLNGKKACGILIENAFSGENISSSVVGIGLNVCNPLLAELAEIATSMSKEGGEKYAVDEVVARLIANLEGAWTIENYRAYLGYLGERAILLLGDKSVEATLLSVEENGRLTVKIDGERRILSSAEVSVRI